MIRERAPLGPLAAPVLVTLSLCACAEPREARPEPRATPALRTSEPAETTLAEAAPANASANASEPAPACEGPPRCRDATTLTRCQDGAAREERCEAGCQVLPVPREARCAPVRALPAAVLARLSAKPYVEERCEDADGAKRCSYTSMGIAAEVVIRNPEPAVVGRWLLDALAYAPQLEALVERDPSTLEPLLLAAANHVRDQSSRIFPESGTIVEDLGAGPKAFGFDRGVVTPCDDGDCACRINSTRPRTYCGFASAVGLRERAECLLALSGRKGTEAWRAHCAMTHRQALGAPHHPHFRARFFAIGQSLAETCASCSDDQLRSRAEKKLRGR